MGAATATRFALDHPERVAALVLITPAYREAGQIEEGALAYWDRLAETLEAGDIAAFVDASGTAELPERWRKPARLATRQRLERHRHLDAVARALRVVPRSRPFESFDELAAIEVPVLVAATRDEADPSHPLEIAEEYVRRLPLDGQFAARGRARLPAPPAGRSDGGCPRRARRTAASSSGRRPGRDSAPRTQPARQGRRRPCPPPPRR